MADIINSMGVPSIPPYANINELRDWALQMNNYIKNLHLTGLQHTQFNDVQIQDMIGSDLSQAGRTFYNLDTNEFQGALIESGAIAIKTFTVA